MNFGARLRDRPDAETEDAGAASAHVFVDQRFFRAVRQRRVFDPGDLRMVAQISAAWTAFSQWRSIRTGRVSMPCRIRKLLKGEIAAPVLRSGTTRARPMKAAGPSARRRPRHDGRVRFVQPGEAGFLLIPGKWPESTMMPPAGAMAARVLGQRMDHDVGAVFEWAAQIRVGTVLSTISGTPWAWATAAKAPKSTTFAAGLPMDSQNTALVLPSIKWPMASMSR